MPLVLTPATRAAITTLAERAYLQPYTPAHTKRLFHTPLPERSLIAPHGYRISFVVGQCRPHWPCRHLRVTGPERWPLMPDVRYLMDAFRFTGPRSALGPCSKCNPCSETGGGLTFGSGSPICRQTLPVH